MTDMRFPMSEKEFRSRVAELKANGLTKIRHYQERGQNWSRYELRNGAVVFFYHEIDADYKRTGNHREE
jgi:hypothetical protein